MWYFIHIPKCAGSFVKDQLGIVIGHTHNNIKLKNMGMGRLITINDNIPGSFDYIYKGNFEKQKIAGTGFAIEGGEFVESFQRTTKATVHQPLASRYVGEINPENGDGGVATGGAGCDQKITSEKTFTIVRNPFSWLASYYHHSDTDGALGWEWVNEIHDLKSFKEFVVHYCTCESRDWHEPCLQRFMAFQLFDGNDDMVPKYIIYKERLYEGIEEYLGHKITAQINRKTYPAYDYREMYDNEMIDLVNEKMKHELKLFNYDFEGPKNDNVGFVDLKHKYNIIKNEHVVLS